MDLIGLGLRVDTKGVKSGIRDLDALDKHGRKAEKGLNLVAGAAKAAGGALAVMFTARSLKAQVDFSDKLLQINKRIGASTEALSEYEYVAKQAGVQFNTLTTAWQRQTRRLAEAAQGTSVASDALEELKLNASELAKLKPEQQFERIAEAMQGVESQSRQAALAMKVWDTEGVQLLQMINQGTHAMQSQREEARRLGLTVSEVAARDMAELNGELGKLSAVSTGVNRAILADLVPSITAAVAGFGDFIDRAGGVSRILDELKGVALAVSTVIAGRYLASFAAVTAAKIAATQQAIAYQTALASMSGIAGRASAAQGTLAVATRGAGAAMALLGGPVGLVTLAAGALVYFSSKSSQAKRDADSLRGRVDLLSESFDNLGRAEARAALVDFSDMAKQLENDLAIASARVETLNTQLMRNPGSEQVGEWLKQLDKAKGAVETATKAVDKHNKDMERLEKIADGVAKKTKAVTSETENHTEAVKNNTEATDDSNDSKKEAANALEALKRQLDPAYAKSQDLAESFKVLDRALNEGLLGPDTKKAMREYNRLWAQIHVSQHDAIELFQDVGAESSEMERLFTRSIDRMDDASASMWRSFIDGSGSAFDSFKRIALDTLAEVIHQYTTKRIIANIGINGGVGGAGGAAGGGAGGATGGIGDLFQLGSLAKSASGLIGGAKAAWGAISGGYASGGISGAVSGLGGYVSGLFSSGSAAAAAGTSLGGVIGGVGSTVAPNLATAGVSGSLSTAGWGAGGAGTGAGGIGGAASAALPYLAAAGGGYLVGSQLGGYGGAGGAIGATVGMLGGPLGAVIGGAIGSVVGSLFGQKWKTVTDETRIDVGEDGIEGHRYKREKKKRTFRSSKYKTTITKLDEEATDALDQQYDAIVDSVSDMFDAIGVATEDSALRSVDIDQLRIATGTSPEKVSEAIAEWFGEIAQELTGSVDAELSYEELADLAGSLTSVNDIVKKLNISTLDLSKRNAEYSQELIKLAGGLEAMASQAAYYYDTFFSEEEKLANTTQAVADVFKELNYSVPSSNEGFRDIVESLDLTSETGRVAYAALMQVAPAFVIVSDAAKKAASEIAQAAAEAISTAKGEVEKAWDSYLKTSVNQELAILELLGDESAILALKRKEELKSIDESLRPTQEKIWALQDEAKAQQDAVNATLEYMTALGNVRSELDGLLLSVSQWVDSHRLNTDTDLSVNAAGAQFDRQYALAQSGDRSALQSITQYADRSMNAGISGASSASEARAIQRELIKQMEALPDAISAEEFIAQEIKDALQEQTAIINSELTDALEKELEKTADRQLTVAQVKQALAGKATDAEIESLIKAVDKNGDGIITSSELIAHNTKSLSGAIGAVLKPMFDGIDLNTDGLIDWGEFKSAFEGMASDEELKAIFDKLDETGSGTISAVEAGNFHTEGVEDNTSELDAAAQKQLDALNAHRQELERQTSQFVGLNSNMKSLSDVLSELVGIQAAEAERIAEEKRLAEEARLEAERKRQAEAARIKHNAAIDAQLAELGGQRSDVMGKAQDAIDKALSLQQSYIWMSGKGGKYASFVVGKEGIEIDYEYISHNAGAEVIAEFRRKVNELLIPNVYGGNRELQRIAKEIAALESQKYAKGGAFTNGIVDKPTMFNIGEMGEAGPEAIMPLMRGAGGELGVKAWVPPTALAPQSVQGNAGSQVRFAVDAMRTEMAQLLRGILASSKETSSLLDDWDTIGQPTFREVGGNGQSGSILTV